MVFAPLMTQKNERNYGNSWKYAAICKADEIYLTPHAQTTVAQSLMIIGGVRRKPKTVGEVVSWLPIRATQH